jgi:hypothetical protein
MTNSQACSFLPLLERFLLWYVPAQALQPVEDKEDEIEREVPSGDFVRQRSEESRDIGCFGSLCEILIVQFALL